MGGIERGERNLTIQTIFTVARGLELTLSALLADIEREAGLAEKTPGKN
jgi:transcriptional regulator with XRE-family HTH domain